MQQEWQTAHLRFSVFSATPIADTDRLFEDFFRLPPESRSSQKASFVTELTAQRDNAVHRLIATGPKLDLVIAAAIEAGTVPNALPVLAGAEKIRQAFVSASRELIGRLEGVRRVAVGEQLVLPAASRSEAYRRMSSFLPDVKVDSEGSSDFLYRINRPRRIDIDKSEVVVNRLSHWVCVVLLVNIRAGDVTQSMPVSDAVSLTTDVNSVPEYDVSHLSPHNRGVLVETLFAMSQEIAEKGDIA